MGNSLRKPLEIPLGKSEAMQRSQSRKPLDVTTLVGRSMRMQRQAASCHKPLHPALESDLQLVQYLENDLANVVDAFARMDVHCTPSAGVLSPPASKPPRKMNLEKDIFTLLRTNSAMTLSSLEKALQVAHPHELRMNVSATALELHLTLFVSGDCSTDP